MQENTSFFKIIFNIVAWSFIGVFVLVGIFTVISNLNSVKAFKSFIVQSGSMEPSIMTGDVIIVSPRIQYVQGDVVTFTDENNHKTTHRIISLKDQSLAKPSVFQTKGDANRAQDRADITASQIIGKVTLVIPKLGYVIAFSRSLPGMILLVGIPASLIILDEILKFTRRRSKR